eukprot:364472-Chlamydomonas_euryale.AAC.2
MSKSYVSRPASKPSDLVLKSVFGGLGPCPPVILGLALALLYFVGRPAKNAARAERGRGQT